MAQGANTAMHSCLTAWRVMGKTSLGSTVSNHQTVKLPLLVQRSSTSTSKCEQLRMYIMSYATTQVKFCQPASLKASAPTRSKVLYKSEHEMENLNHCQHISWKPITTQNRSAHRERGMNTPKSEGKSQKYQMMQHLGVNAVMGMVQHTILLRIALKPPLN